MRPDDRKVSNATEYCTDFRGKDCQYVDNHVGRMGGCRLFPNRYGRAKALRMGREWQSLRCLECRAIDAGCLIPDAIAEHTAHA